MIRAKNVKSMSLDIGLHFGMSNILKYYFLGPLLLMTLSIVILRSSYSWVACRARLIMALSAIDSFDFWWGQC